ncbi:MAG: glucuronate isomerase [Litorilinea sp.]
MSTETELILPEDRYFDRDPAQLEIAQHLYGQVRGLPLICPHGHVDPKVFADADYSFGSPADLLIIPDHYIFRMLYSQGIPLEALGIAPRADAPDADAGAAGNAVETDHRKIWQLFADHYYLFRGTPTGMWLNHELYDVFGVRQRLTSATAQSIYDQIAEKLTQPEFRPRRLYERFNIETLCTTDAATSTLADHQAIRDSGWQGRVLPTFRPDALINLTNPDWAAEMDRLRDVCGRDIADYAEFIVALEERRAHFKAMGAVATDHAAATPFTHELSEREATELFDRALQKELDPGDAERFTAHMLMEMARMSVDDGLVMQLHPGSYRNHNRSLFNRFGTDMGADIPLATEFTRNLQPLLNKYGNNPRFHMVLFMLDESTLGRELAPLAGHYPALRLGPPWWFFDSWNGMKRYRELVSETAGLYNTAGFNDDTRAYPSIPARHDLARRVDANWLADLAVRHLITVDEAE